MSVGPFQGKNPVASTVSTGNVTTAETTLGTSTLQAQGFSPPTSVVHVVAWGTVANNANAKTLTLYFGATSQAFTLQTSVANSWKLDAYFVSSSSSAQLGSASVVCGVAAGSTAEAYTIAPAENVLSNIVVKITGTATATNDILCKAFIIFT